MQRIHFTKKLHVAKLAKKQKRLTSQIKLLEDSLMNALHKKSSSQAEINLPARTLEIAKLRKEFILVNMEILK